MDTNLELLNSFDPGSRRAVLGQLLERGGLPATGSNVNMHLHSFFSFNAEDHSPTRLAWEARKNGLYAAGLCDFDVLDGLDEFLDAGCRLALRTSVGLETRAFFDEYADADINSPGEPGITYIMGAGFGRIPAPNSPAAQTLAVLRDRAAQRNRDLVARINAKIPALSLEYRSDVMPLSPAACPTERHIIRAYCRKAASLGDDAATKVWAEILDQPSATVNALLANRPVMEDAVRARLVKRGGLAYEAPTRTTFPAVADFVPWVLSARAIPMATWLDGTSAGESDPAAMLECLQAKGVAAINIVPDRNWNISDATKRQRNVDNLRNVVKVAVAMNLPINIGTEMNKEGQPFVDDLTGPALKEFAETFRDGARVMVGQTILARYADYAFCDPSVLDEFNGKAAKRNRFFAAVGALPPMTVAEAERLAAAGPNAALEYIREAVQKNQ